MNVVPFTETHFRFALALLESVLVQIDPLPGRPSALCRVIDDFLQTGEVKPEALTK